MTTATRLERAAASREANAAIIASGSDRKAPALPESFPTNFPPPTAISEQLFAANIDLANASANRWAAKCPVPLDDLMSITRQGLLRGCRKYDPNKVNPSTGRPYAISTLVCPFIEGEVLHWFRDNKTYAVKFPMSWRKAWGKVQRMAGAGSTAAEISAATNLPEAEVIEMLGAMEDTIPLDESTIPEADTQLHDDMVSAMRRLADQSTDKISRQDQGLISAWWDDPRRRSFPAGPFQWVNRAWGQLMKGRKVKEFIQQELPLGVVVTVAPVLQVKTKAPRRQRVIAETPALPGLKVSRRRET
jgi:DNA-directed RNA polymerase specialized sigma subunit